MNGVRTRLSNIHVDISKDDCLWIPHAVTNKGWSVPDILLQSLLRSEDVNSTYFMGFLWGFSEFTYTMKLLAPCLVLGKCSVNLSHHFLGRRLRAPKWASVPPVNAFLNYLSLPPRLVPCFWAEAVESLRYTAGPDSFLNSLAEVLSPPGTTTSFSEKWAHLSGLAS